MDPPSAEIRRYNTRARVKSTEVDTGIPKGLAPTAATRGPKSGEAAWQLPAAESLSGKTIGGNPIQPTRTVTSRKSSLKRAATVKQSENKPINLPTRSKSARATTSSISSQQGKKPSTSAKIVAKKVTTTTSSPRNGGGDVDKENQLPLEPAPIGQENIENGASRTGKVASCGTTIGLKTSTPSLGPNTHGSIQELSMPSAFSSAVLQPAGTQMSTAQPLRKPPARHVRDLDRPAHRVVRTKSVANKGTKEKKVSSQEASSTVSLPPPKRPLRSSATSSAPKRQTRSTKASGTVKHTTEDDSLDELTTCPLSPGLASPPRRPLKPTKLPSLASHPNPMDSADAIFASPAKRLLVPLFKQPRDETQTSDIGKELQQASIHAPPKRVAVPKAIQQTILYASETLPESPLASPPKRPTFPRLKQNRTFGSENNVMEDEDDELATINPFYHVQATSLGSPIRPVTRGKGSVGDTQAPGLGQGFPVLNLVPFLKQAATSCMKEDENKDTCADPTSVHKDEFAKANSNTSIDVEGDIEMNGVDSMDVDMEDAEANTTSSLASNIETQEPLVSKFDSLGLEGSGTPLLQKNSESNSTISPKTPKMGIFYPAKKEASKKVPSSIPIDPLLIAEDSKMKDSTCIQIPVKFGEEEPAYKPSATRGHTRALNVCNILAGAVVYLDVHTTDGADCSPRLSSLLISLGARVVKQWNWNSKLPAGHPNSKIGITHVVFREGSPATLRKVKEANGVVVCVGISWVIDCDRSKTWIDEGAYLIDLDNIPRGGHNRRKSMEPLSIETHLSGIYPQSPSSKSSKVHSHQNEFRVPIDAEDRCNFGPTANQLFSPLRKQQAQQGIPSFPYTPLRISHQPLYPVMVDPNPDKLAQGREEIARNPILMERLLLARRKSMQFAPKHSSPLAKNVMWA